MADPSAVGKEYSPVVWEVERGKIRELIQAIDDKNPIYVDRESAVREGYKDCPASPTYITLPFMWRNIGVGFLQDMGVNLAKILHGEETYEYFREIYPGDVLTGRPKIVSVDQKSGKAGSMDIIRSEVMYTDQKNEPVVKVTTVLIERK